MLLINYLSEYMDFITKKSLKNNTKTCPLKKNQCDRSNTIWL